MVSSLVLALALNFTIASSPDRTVGLRDDPAVQRTRSAVERFLISRADAWDPQELVALLDRTKASRTVGELSAVMGQARLLADGPIGPRTPLEGPTRVRGSRTQSQSTGMGDIGFPTQRGAWMPSPDGN
ncbi:MAG: hypothetical protein AAF533_07920 [Acidobacteriota bacterium]